MSARPTVRLVAALAAATLLLPATAGAHHGPTSYRRLYLLAENDGRAFWSVSPDESTAEARTIRRHCPDVPRLPGDEPCRGAVTPQGHPVTIWFQPRSRVAQPVSWGSEQPALIRLAVSVDSLSAYTVEAVVASGSSFTVRPATQTSPGIWEATLPTGAIDPEALPEIGVRVTLAPTGTATVTVRTDGSSYVELAQPFLAWSFDELVRRSPAAEVPTEFTSPLRSFRFNDDRWQVWSFTGKLTQERSWEVDLPERATFVMAWVETYAEPWLHHLIRRGELSAERLTDTPRVRLVRGDEVLAYGYNLEDEQTGRGTDQAAALDVAPGPLDLTVLPSDYAQGAGYRAYVLAAYGPRTLASMRSSFTPNHWYILPTAQAGGVAVCPGNAEGIPLPPEVRGMSLDIDADSVNPTVDWTIRWSKPGGGDLPCGWAGSGDDLHLVDRNALLRWGPTPGYDDTHVSYRDTVIDAEVRLFYEPPPHPEEEGSA